MFTTKPESGEKITKLGGGVGDAKTPFTERPTTYASKSSGLSAHHMPPMAKQQGFACHRIGLKSRKKQATQPRPLPW